jgi:hypothetical protein
VQAKLMEKKMTLTLNVIDPFRQQENKSFTFGNNFVLENFSTTGTRNIRLTLGYNFTGTPKKKATKTTEKNKKQLQKMLEQQKSKVEQKS